MPRISYLRQFQPYKERARGHCRTHRAILGVGRDASRDHLASIFLIVFVLRSRPLAAPKRGLRRSAPGGTAIAVLLCWLGVSSQPGFATFGEWCDQLVSVQRRYPLWRYPLFGGQ